MRDKKIINITYVVQPGIGISTLSEEVKEWIEGGWQPYGVPFSEDGTLVQTVVKYENDE